MNENTWVKYPEEKPRLVGHYFVTYKRGGKVYTKLDKFISSEIFACEIYGWQVLAWATVSAPSPDPKIVAEAEDGEE